MVAMLIITRESRFKINIREWNERVTEFVLSPVSEKIGFMVVKLS
jgi:hypothetical protein